LVKNTGCGVHHYAIFSMIRLPHFYVQISSSTSVLRNPQSMYSLKVRDQVSHPYSTTGKILVMFILIFRFFDMRQEDRRFWTEWQQAFPEFNLLLNSLRMSFWFVSVVPKYLNFATFSNNSLPILIFWFCPEFGWRDMIIYFVFSAFFLDHHLYQPVRGFLCSLLWYYYGILSPNKLISSL
jgi:hypothetical protein